MLKNKQKQLLNELKDVVLKTHRLAGQLDSMIQIIEDEEAIGPIDEDYINSVIKDQINLYKGLTRRKGLDKLYEKTNDILEELLKTTKKGS